MLSYTLGQVKSITEAVKLHRAESNYIFAGLHIERGPGPKRPPPVPPQWTPRPKGAAPKGGGKGIGKESKGRANQGKGKGKDSVKGSEICGYYNRPRGCKFPDCPRLHRCNKPGCQELRPAYTHGH